jgi:hypothetical protein
LNLAAQSATGGNGALYYAGSLTGVTASKPFGTAGPSDSSVFPTSFPKSSCWTYDAVFVADRFKFPPVTYLVSCCEKGTTVTGATGVSGYNSLTNCAFLTPNSSSTSCPCTMTDAVSTQSSDGTVLISNVIVTSLNSDGVLLYVKNGIFANPTAITLQVCKVPNIAVCLSDMYLNLVRLNSAYKALSESPQFLAAFPTFVPAISAARAQYYQPDDNKDDDPVVVPQGASAGPSVSVVSPNVNRRK